MTIDIDTATRPAFYIFTQQDGRARCIGAAFRHKGDNGYNLVIHRQHYLGLVPKVDARRGETTSTSLKPPGRLSREFNRKSSRQMQTVQPATARKGERHDHAVRPAL